MLTNRFDVIILGSGPIGSAAGRRTAQLGLTSPILGKEEPRLHISESLLPYVSAQGRHDSLGEGWFHPLRRNLTLGQHGLDEFLPYDGSMRTCA